MCWTHSTIYKIRKRNGFGMHVYTIKTKGMVATGGYVMAISSQRVDRISLVTRCVFSTRSKSQCTSYTRPFTQSHRLHGSASHHVFQTSTEEFQINLIWPKSIGTILLQLLLFKFTVIVLALIATEANLENLLIFI